VGDEEQKVKQFNLTIDLDDSITGADLSAMVDHVARRVQFAVGNNAIPPCPDIPQEAVMFSGARAGCWCVESVPIDSFVPIPDDPEYCLNCSEPYSSHGPHDECCDPNTNEKEDLMMMQRRAER
jgi:hypothetical protein